MAAVVEYDDTAIREPLTVAKYTYTDAKKASYIKGIVVYQVTYHRVTTVALI